MKADSLTARDLFGKQVRYVIPTFQRPYVWNQEDQWEPFWEDVQYAAERYLEELGEDGPQEPESAARALERAGRHFLGAVVVKQQLTATSQVETREVIDGQQRLTTLQLLLDAARRVALEKGWDDVAFQMEELTRNDARYARKDETLVFKLWPTTTDEQAFQAAMHGEADGEQRQSRLVRAHEYFQARVRDWVDWDHLGDDAARRGEALASALIGLLEIVVIDLGASDDAFVIFETLNARGTPLLASDLVKNYLMQTASQRDGQSPEEISARYWQQFDTDWWRQDVRQGRLRRPRIDTFLDYWLEARLAEEVASHEVFPKFKDLVDTHAEPISSLAGDIGTHAHVFRQLHHLDRYTRDGTFLYRWEQLDIGVLTPLLMWVFRWSPGELPPARRTRILVHLESYIVRRMVLRLTTKQYNRTFLEVLRLVHEAGPAEADDVVIDFLLKAQGDSTRWPTDPELHHAFRELPVYRLLTRSRVRTVLEAIEDDHRDAKSEDQFVTRGKLTIEHVMPQTWRTHWALHESPDRTAAELRRDQLVQSFGNLTLATSSLNSSMSNHRWEDKREHLEANSVLHLNRGILGQVGSDGVWDETAITARADGLYERARGIWPRP